MRLRLALLAVATLAGGVSAARALPTASQIKTAFDALDASHNAAINSEEWDRASFALFRAADKNNNNVLEPDELKGGAIPEATFLRTDTDHDGRLSVAEFMALRRALFQIADIDRDDTLTFVEYELFLVMEQVGWTDHNRNSRIELSELSESLAKAFAQFDTDHDGQLSAEEAAYIAREEFAKFDANHDGKLTSAEFTGGYRAALLGSN